MNALQAATSLVELLEAEDVRVGCWRTEARDAAVAVHCRIDEAATERLLFRVRPREGTLRVELRREPTGDVEGVDVATVGELAQRQAKFLKAAQCGHGLGPGSFPPPRGLALEASFVAHQSVPDSGSGEPAPAGTRMRLIESILIPRESVPRLVFLTAGDKRRRIELHGMDPHAQSFLADPSAFVRPDPGDECCACGRRLSEPVASLSYEVMDATYDEAWFHCACGAHMQTLEREGLTGVHRKVSGPIDSVRANATIDAMRTCADPTNGRCRCAAHETARGGF